MSVTLCSCFFRANILCLVVNELMPVCVFSSICMSMGSIRLVLSLDTF